MKSNHNFLIMARKMFKFYTILLYFLAILMGFFLGIMYAGWIEAGKGQMLAAGAIVLGYGVMGSAIGLVFALAVAYWAHRRFIIGGNIVMALMVTGFLAYFMGKHQRKQKAEPVEVPPKTQLPDKKIASPAINPSTGVKSADTFTREEAEVENNQPNDPPTHPAHEIGLGLFAPDILSGQPLYFYRRPITEWPPSDSDIIDSVMFHRDQYDNLAIATAPPWFLPEHQKVDYGILFMRIISVHRNTLEVEVNNKTGRTAVILKEPGRIVFWPEFILSVSSIELLDNDSQEIRVKPLDYAGEVRIKYSILRPVAIQSDWVQVHLLDNNLKKKGGGWIKWRENGRLLVQYSLFS